MRRLLALFCAVLCLVLSACSSANPYELSMAEGEIGEQNYIYYNEDLVVYVVGGIMTVKINGETKLLELALNDGDVTVQEILNSAESDAESEEITRTEYPDGSVEYSYDSFNLVRLNTYAGKRDVYFVPKSMGYSSLAH